VIALGRPLTETEIAAKVRVVSVPYIPGGYDGMTLGYHVLLARPVGDDGQSALLAHELVHVRQWAEDGRIRFSTRYVLSFLRGLASHKRWGPAYRSVDAEVEARIETTDWLRRSSRAGEG
jgi:hypothetical protein